MILNWQSISWIFPLQLTSSSPALSYTDSQRQTDCWLYTKCFTEPSAHNNVNDKCGKNRETRRGGGRQTRERNKYKEIRETRRNNSSNESNHPDDLIFIAYLFPCNRGTALIYIWFSTCGETWDTLVFKSFRWCAHPLSYLLCMSKFTPNTCTLSQTLGN